jgi:hypothetical protein
VWRASDQECCLGITTKRFLQVATTVMSEFKYTKHMCRPLSLALSLALVLALVLALSCSIINSTRKINVNFESR